MVCPLPHGLPPPQGPGTLAQPGCLQQVCQCSSIEHGFAQVSSLHAPGAETRVSRTKPGEALPVPKPQGLHLKDEDPPLGLG